VGCGSFARASIECFSTPDCAQLRLAAHSSVAEWTYDTAGQVSHETQTHADGWKFSVIHERNALGNIVKTRMPVVECNVPTSKSISQ
jgi:hypothetical protein